MPEKAWTAGTHYLKNLFLALSSLKSGTPPEITLLVAHNAGPGEYQALRPYVGDVLHMPLLPSPPGHWRRRLVRLGRRLGIWQETSSPLGAWLRAHEVDVCFVGGTEFGPRFAVPLLAWIPDFQHLCLPHMFSTAEATARTAMFRRIVSFADRVVVSSKAALGDLECFFPEEAHKGRVVSFVAQVPGDLYEADPGWVCKQYELPERFIYLPNQFWKHKNHKVVVQALALVKAKRPEMTVVCSGNTSDYRDPGYFDELTSEIAGLGLRDNVRILGLIPHPHVYQLMRQSLAVLQPSLFEGWSTSVEEAKSVGKRLILSDITVHREQQPRHATYFDPNDAEMLASCLVEAHDTWKPGPDAELESWARQQLPGRTREFGQRFVDVVRQVTSG